MARLPQLEAFGVKHGLKTCSVADVIAWRRKTESLIEKVVSVRMPTKFGDFRLHLYRSKVDEYLHMALCAGDVGRTADGQLIPQKDPVLVRVHSECLTGDIFGSLRCDCGWQLEESMRAIGKAGKGCILYIRQEGRGIGLVNKLKAYALQEQGVDTVEANLRLGFPPDLRDYGIGAQILVDLGIRKLRLLTNNPRKIVALSGFGLEVAERAPISAPATDENRAYLASKRDRMGHLFGDLLKSE